MRKEVIQKFQEFVKSISKDDVVAVLHDTDPDGVSSGVVVAKAVNKLRGKPIDLRLNQKSNEKQLSDSSLELLKSKKVTFLITTDMALDQDDANLQKVASFAKVVVIDHHKIYADINSDKIVLIKAEYMDDSIVAAKYPTAKLAYDLFSSVVDISDIDWIACIGTICDIAYDQWSEFVDGVFKRYNVEMKENIFDTTLARAGVTISQVEGYDNTKIKDCFEVLYEAKSFEDVLNSRLKEWSDIFEGQLNKWIRIFEEKLEREKDHELVVFQIESELSIKSNLCTIFGLRYPHKTLILFQVKEDLVLVSARRGDRKVAVNELLEKSVTGFSEARAGGHPVAAGATLKREYLGSFLQRLQAFHEECRV